MPPPPSSQCRVRVKATRPELEELIEQVHEYPILYDKSHSQYKDTALKEHTWTIIGNQLGLTGEVAQNRWKNLKDRYVKELKKYERKQQSCGKYVQKPSWEFYAILGEFFNHTRPKQITNELQEESESSNFDMSDNDQVETMTESQAESSHTVAPYVHNSLTQGGSAILIPNERVQDVISSHSLATTTVPPVDQSKFALAPVSKVLPVCHTSSYSSSNERKRKSYDGDDYIDSILQYINSGFKVINKEERVESDIEMFLLSFVRRLQQLPKQKLSLARLKFEQVLFELEND